MKLFVLLLVIVLFILWKKNKNKSDALKDGLFKQGPGKPRSNDKPESFHASPSPGQVDELIACSICGVHVPKAQLVLGAKDQYQCAKHH